MAIGDTNNNSNNSNKLYENTYYSRLRVKNGNLALSSSFKSGLLLLEITELKEGFKYEPIIAIYLSPTKAKLLAKEIDIFIKYLNSDDIDPNKGFGVNAGMNDKVSYIAFHADEDKTVFITIGKIDGSGNILEKSTISLNKEYHFTLQWDNINTMDVAKSYYDNLELEQLKELINDFGHYMNGVIGYSVADIERFDTARILRKMDPIYDKLGIERLSSGNSYNKGNSFLDNSRSVSSNHISTDDINDLLE